MTDKVDSLERELSLVKRDVANFKSLIEGDPYRDPPMPSLPLILIQISDDLKANAEMMIKHDKDCQQYRKEQEEKRLKDDRRMKILETAKSRWLWMVTGGTTVIVVMAKVADWVYQYVRQGNP